jgi:hypothetical protein
MTVGDGRSGSRITIASLCFDRGETKFTSTESSEQRRLCGSNASSPPDVLPTWTQGRQFGCLDTTVTFPSLFSARSSSFDGSALVTQLHCVARSNTTNESNGTFNVISSTDGGPTHLDKRLDNICNVNTSIGQRHEGFGEMAAPVPSALFTPPGVTNAIHTHHGAGLPVQSVAEPFPTQSPRRTFRTARPAYTEEQKFFIMYNRIIKELSWPETEDKFESHFDARSGDGLTSVYYRVRKDWGMEKVLKTKPGSSSNRTKVEARVAYFSKDFLEKLGYFD